MSKHKLPRKSTNIDMTAMCDVAFLLLTFFMLATKFKPDEPVVVKTPSSISEILIPENSILLTIDKGGKVFFAYDNTEAKGKLIEAISEDKGLNLTATEKQNFVNGSSVGSPLNQLKSFLALEGITKGEYQYPGIPVSDSSFLETENEMIYWVQRARTAGQEVGDPPRICIKADSETPYPKIKQVIGSMVKNKIDRFNLITSAEAVPPGSIADQERSKEQVN